LKTGLAPIATVMRRLLTGHAVFCFRIDISHFYAKKSLICWSWFVTSI
jgi:hypothetical protein